VIIMRSLLLKSQVRSITQPRILLSNAQSKLKLQNFSSILQYQKRLFSGGGKHDDVISNSPGYNKNSTDPNNPYQWDPHYVPSEESDFDRDPQDVRLRQPLPEESFIPREQVLQRVILILNKMERAQTQGKTLNDNTHFTNDLGLDSLDQVEFGLALEDEFDIEIPDEEAEQIVTIGDAVDLIADHPHAK